MFREKVKSESIESIGYNPTDLTLEIEFRTGGVYRYLNVPESVYFALMAASSKGRYFDHSIRDRFVCRKVG